MYIAIKQHQKKSELTNFTSLRMKAIRASYHRENRPPFVPPNIYIHTYTYRYRCIYVYTDLGICVRTCSDVVERSTHFHLQTEEETMITVERYVR